MTTVNKIIVDVLTNEIENIPLTDAEIKALAKQASQEENDRLALEAEAKAKAIAKAEILDRIGLTADELKTILG